MYMRYIVFVLLFSISLFGIDFSKKATVEPYLVQKGDAKQWCPICGMKIKDYYKTSYIAKLKDTNISRQYCSMRCLLKDMQEYTIDTNSIQVVDAATQKYIKANDAFYLVKSKVIGTMSKNSKLAFKDKKDALKFKKRFRGKIVDFQKAFSLAKESFESDNNSITKRKEKRSYKRGQRVFNHICQKDKIDPNNYLEINDLKADIVKNHLCKKTNEKNLQALALYLWDVKRFGDLNQNDQRVKVTHDEKCPVCGMFTYKYPRWAAQIFYDLGDKGHRHLSFDGVKDLMKFYFNANRWGNYTLYTKNNIHNILVTDYYTQKSIDGTKAYYVIGSNIYGPMGHEFIPFKTKDDADVFMRDHYGSAILKFGDITESQVYQLDKN